MPPPRWTRRGFAVALPTILLCACTTRSPTPRPTVASAEPKRIAPPSASQTSPPTTFSHASATAPTAAPALSTTVVPSPTNVPPVVPATPLSSASSPTPPKPSPADVAQTTHLVRHGVTDLAKGTLGGVEALANGLTLATGAAGYGFKGTVTSPELPAAFSFDTLVPSWNASAPSGTSLRCEVRIRANASWSGWYVLGQWSADARGSVEHQRDAFGTVDVDTLKLSVPAQSFQYRITLTTASPQQTPTLRLVAINYANLQSSLSGPRVNLPSGWARDLPVPVQSQLLQAANLAWDVCSPTSLAMVLQFWKVTVGVPEVIDGVRDQTNGIYGNWPFNTAYAALHGLEAYVNRFTSIADLQYEIAAGRPVITSIRFAAGELSNAPIASASGHLLVVRGFTPAGDVIVNDPVAPTLAGVRRVYRRDQFANVWLNHGGVVYQVRPLAGSV